MDFLAVRAALAEALPFGVQPRLVEAISFFSGVVRNHVTVSTLACSTMKRSQLALSLCAIAQKAIMDQAVGGTVGLRGDSSLPLISSACLAHLTC